MKTEDQKEYKNYISRNRTGKAGNKDKALKAVNRLLEIVFDAPEDIVSRAVLELPVLLDYFSPSIASKAKTDSNAWAQAAPNRKDLSPFKNTCIAWHGHIIGTDGRLLLMARDKVKGVEDFKTLDIHGRPDGGTISPIAFERVMPYPGDCQKAEIVGKTVEGTGKAAVYWLEFSTGQRGKYNAKLFDLLTAAGEEGLYTNTSNICEYDSNKSGPLVGIDTPERYGVLMPIRHG